MGKVKRLELWWQLYRTSLPDRDLENFRPMDFCWTECTLHPADVNIALLPRQQHPTTPNKTHIPPWDTIMRFLVINYQQKHHRLRMSSHLLRKQLVTGFLMSVSSIYQTKIGRGKEIRFFYCRKGKQRCIYGLQSTSSRRQPFLLDLLNSRQRRGVHFQGPATQNAVCRSGLRSLSAAECYILSRLF